MLQLGDFVAFACDHDFFTWYFGSCIGESCNPGPSSASVKLAVVNPTAMNGKIGRLLQMKANVMAISETSATTIVQKECAREFSSKGYRCFWSKPVAPKKTANDLRPCYRGEAVGCAVISNLPCRETRIEISEAYMGNTKIFLLYFQIGKH